MLRILSFRGHYSIFITKGVRIVLRNSWCMRPAPQRPGGRSSTVKSRRRVTVDADEQAVLRDLKYGRLKRELLTIFKLAAAARLQSRRCATLRRLWDDRKEDPSVGGSEWESNPPATSGMPPAGFEDRDDHRTACASVLSHGTVNRPAAVPHLRPRYVGLSSFFLFSFRQLSHSSVDVLRVTYLTVVVVRLRRVSHTRLSLRLLTSSQFTGLGVQTR